jgi:hypothetical protein
MKFDESDAAAIAAAKEVRIETRSASGEAHRTIIWIVEHDGSIYIRSVNGPTARWYREALANPDVAIHFGGRRLSARAVPATDPASIQACSEGLRAKYRRSYSLESMLLADTLPTTLRLEPTEAVEAA